MMDLHIHSNYSDGNKSPREIIEECKNKGISVISFTDHNTIKEYNDKSISNADIEIIRGAEFYPDMDNINMFHLLAYDFDLTDDIISLFDELDNNRLVSMMEKLDYIRKNYDIDIDINDLDHTWLSNYTLRNYLLEKYPAEDADKIIDAINKSGFKIKKRIDCIRLLDTIRNANGIPVLAHPKTIIYDDFDGFVKRLVDNGLMGIETYYSSHNPEEAKKYLEIAKKYNLLISGGSDFHGYGKKDYNGNDVELGGYYCDDPSKISVLKYIRGDKNV